MLQMSRHTAFDLLLLWRKQVMTMSKFAASLAYSLDLFLPTSISPLHYVVPGVLTDGSLLRSSSAHALWKAAFRVRMARFAALCVVPSLSNATMASSTFSLATRSEGSPTQPINQTIYVQSLPSLPDHSRLVRSDWVPPVLWSFPGSGNTWLRALLEATTGLSTGSVYHDRCLLCV